MKQSDLNGALVVIEAYIIESKYPAHEARFTRQEYALTLCKAIREACPEGLQKEIDITEPAFDSDIIFVDTHTAARLLNQICNGEKNDG